MEKVVNNLVGYKNLKIVQCDDFFNFSLESVLLPNFVTVNKKTQKILDLGCGNAPIPLILSTKTDAEIYGIELQKEVFKLAEETLILNNLSDRITIINDDIKNLKSLFSAESLDTIITNPPYFQSYEKSNKNKNLVKTIARHEVKITVEEIANISFYLLKNKGRIAIIHRTERLCDIIKTLKDNKLEPKRLAFIFPRKNSDSNLFLIEAVKNASPGIKVEKPIIIHDKNGNYSDRIRKVFNGGSL